MKIASSRPRSEWEAQDPILSMIRHTGHALITSFIYCLHAHAPFLHASHAYYKEEKQFRNHE